MENDVKFRIIGNVSLLPADMVELIYKIEHLTKNNSKAILNVAFAYTGKICSNI